MENGLSTLLELLKQILIGVSIVSGSSILTGLTNAAINIKNDTVKHIVSWVIPIVVAVILCAAGTISFGYGD